MAYAGIFFNVVPASFSTTCGRSAALAELIRQLVTGVDSSSIYKLELGKTISREMRVGESHEYQFVLAVEEYARIEIDQRSIDLAFAAIAPDRAP